MKRVPEPELMLDPDQALAYASADFAEPHDHFVALLSERLPDLDPKGFAVDLGCGPGDVTRRFARAFPGWRVDAVDGSAAMLDLGRRASADEGLEDRIRYRELFLPTETWRPESCALVFSNSLLHHLAEPATLWTTARKWAAPGGAVFVMDLMRPPSRERAEALVATYADGEPDVLRRDFFHSLLAAYRPDEVAAQLEAAGLGALRVEEVSDRHLAVWGRAA